MTPPLSERLHVVLDKPLMALLRDEAKTTKASLGETTRQLLLEGLTVRRITANRAPAVPLKEGR